MRLEPMTRSLYAILNVSPDADPAVIEAAHRALIRKYHPDVLIGGPESVQSRAAEINEAFQILRDPDKRARYDADQQARRQAAGAALPGHEFRGLPFHPPPPARRTSRWIALALITAMAALVLYVWQRASSGDTAFLAADGRAAGSTKARADGAAALPVSLAQVDRAISEYNRLKETSGLFGLSAYSQDCFAMQSRSSDTNDFDFCVAFDDAVLTYEGGGAKLYSLPKIPRFQPREVALRHAAAGTFVSDDERWVQTRLRDIKALTEQRLQEINAAPVQTSAAGAQPAAGPLREAGRPDPAAAAMPPAYRAPRPAYRAPPRTAARRAPPQRRQAPKKGARRPADADFMERQGYIY